MNAVIAAVMGVAFAASLVALWRLGRGARRGVLRPETDAMQAALHAAAATLPHLRRGLTAESAARAVGHLRDLTGAEVLAIAADRTVLAVAGDDGAELVGAALARAPGGRVHVEPGLAPAPGEPPRDAVVAPLLVHGVPAGSLVAVFPHAGRLRPDDTRVVEEAALLVSSQVELAAADAQSERLAEAELRALRAQISPHFIYNALAAVASYIPTRPDEARDLLTEFAEFTRYAFRGERPYVTLADELRYVEKYLRLEQARFGERLVVTLEVAPEILPAVVPVLSVQPLVENAVRHGVEQRPGVGHVTIIGRDLGRDAELQVRDDGPGMTPEQARAVLHGVPGKGIGLSNVHARMCGVFGPEYGLSLDSTPGTGTTVTMTLPKFQPGVRAA